MALSANHTYQKMLSGDQPTRTKYGNDYRRAYGDADIPLQEPLNIHDESTRFWSEAWRQRIDVVRMATVSSGSDNC